jgi:DNA helicase-2/ATP-dependent DNA helicase PcrA
VSLSLDRPVQTSTRPGRQAGAAFSERAEVRDVLAWMRLLGDPNDAAAVSRALVRPPIELRQSDLVRVIQISRRRRLDMVAALTAAVESPQIPPQARERIQRFQQLHRGARAALEAGRPDLFVRVVVGAEREERPDAGRIEEDCEGGSSGPTERLQATLQLMREEVMGDVTRIARGLSELRLDTDLDVSHGMARYLELLKLTALLERPAGQSVAEALPEINNRLLAAATSMQREIFQTSPLDAALLAAERGAVQGRGRDSDVEGGGGRDGKGEMGRDDGASDGEEGWRACLQALSVRAEPSLAPFLPRIGHGLVLSASDVETYRSCPLKYKYARVLRVPTEQTLSQRFGIFVHQVLERYHAGGASALAELMELQQTAWRRGGFGDSERERELREMAIMAFTRYHARLREQEAEPVWFERSFSFALGPHRVRGRVDRIDRLPDGGYELIDYKTSRPKSEAQLRDDVQLSLYALAAGEDWGLPAPQQAYHYVLDDQKVPVPPRSEGEREWIRQTVVAAGEGIMALAFEPTPSPTACGMCDYRIMCPVAMG